jgi:hypothetical protein
MLLGRVSWAESPGRGLLGGVSWAESPRNGVLLGSVLPSYDTHFSAALGVELAPTGT